MLLCVQFPIADVRRFVDQVERLGTPSWPLPTPDAEFIRFFGTIRARKLGGLDGWVGEDRLCRADRALSFLKNPTLLQGRSKTRIVFRRFYFDGWAVGKFEVGLHTSSRYFPAVLADLEDNLLKLPVQIRNSTGQPMRSELGQAGKHIAQLYHKASMPAKKAIPEEDKWQVRAGTPLLLLELRKEENLSIPKEAKSISLPNWPSDIKLFHYGIPYRGGTTYMWILKVGDSLVQESVARTLRLYLLRLNAEHECLRLLLQSLANKNIQITRGTALSDDLQWYLEKAIKRITRVETKTEQVNEEIAQIARQSINVIRPGQFDVLLDSVNDYRNHLRKQIERFATKDVQTVNVTYLEVQNMNTVQGNQYNFEDFQAGILNIESTLTNVSQSVGSIPGLDSSAKDQLKQLVDQLNVALQKAPAENINDAKNVSKQTKRLIEDISEDQPDKTALPITLEGLKKAAENIGKVLPDVLPIVLQITQFVTKSFGLG